jgi:hypothetical protein
MGMRVVTWHLLHAGLGSVQVKWHLRNLYRQLGDRQKTCCRLKIQEIYKLEVC